MSAEATGGANGVSCPSKAHSTTPPSRQTDFSSRLDARRLSLDDFDLPGLGEEGPDCGTNRMPEKNAICPRGDAVRYEPLNCRRVACPECSPSEERERAFKIAIEIEAAARVRSERPHAVVFSPPTAEGSRYSIEDINTKIARRGYRRARRQCEIEGGYAVLHPARLPDAIEARLWAEGYGPGGDEGGYWQGVRADALDLGDWRAYAEYSPHLHSLGFPGWIEPHQGDDFVIRKYDDLEDLESVVNHTRYLLSHRGLYSGDGRIDAVRPWGLFHHASSEWAGAEEELSDEAYEALAAEIAELMGGEWSAEEGLHYPDEAAECPECGTPKEEFIDLWDLPKLASSKNQGGLEWINRLSSSQRAFFMELIEILHHEQYPRLYRGDVIHPPDVAIWVDGDRPPP